MKNYKGYNKRPYCNTHYPTTKFTQVADTPEMNRIKKNTSNQSSVNYTKEFRELQGKKTSVVDDPETARVKKNTQNQSLAQYHGLQDQRSMENYQREREAENLAGTNRQAMDMPLPTPPSDPYNEPEEPEPVGQPQPQRQVGSLFEREDEAPVGGGYSQGPRYKAIYDYVAAADDEVSFNEGDIIVNGEIIDDGWMTGTVERTGHSGMLPSNYVEPI